MARSLNYSIEYIFNNYGPCGRGACSDADRRKRNMHTVYMEIPIKEDYFELPCFVLACNRPSPYYSVDLDSLDKDAIVVPLNTLGLKPWYTTIGAYMKDVLIGNIKDQGLIKLTTEEGDILKTYYATYGAIFDDSFSPILLCSWKVSRQRTEEGKPYLKLEVPILRVASNCYLRKANQIERFIANKFVQTALECRNTACNMPLSLNNLRVEITDMPFNLRKVETPSISTSNEELLQIARDHINEILQ